MTPDEATIEELRAERDHLRAQLRKVRAIISEHPGSAWDSGIKVVQRITAALGPVDATPRRKPADVQGVAQPILRPSDRKVNRFSADAGGVE